VAIRLGAASGAPIRYRVGGGAIVRRRRRARGVAARVPGGARRPGQRGAGRVAADRARVLLELTLGGVAATIPDAKLPRVQAAGGEAAGWGLAGSLQRFGA